MDIVTVLSTLLASLPTLITAVAGVGAYFLGGLNERKRDERAMAREEAARQGKRAEDLERERHEFQLANLLKLQESLRKVTRSAVLSVIADQRSVAATGTFTFAPSEIDVGAFENTIRFIRLVERVTNDELRQTLNEFGSHLGTLSLPPMNWADLTKEASERILNARFSGLAPRSKHIAELLGLHLREELNRRDSR
ncbi:MULTISPECIES: hypothetical protein [Cryobacterium]|uniref:Uncharacterized protein n=1 Tax=Cryobacterium glucosi TaxID=1259175 RepID=A0ABY2ITT7_9MICO|nr:MULTISPECIES: hypothetical protein [Cryobacterium]TFB99724.1 hypothetical protein E3O39_02995 [Cryobacterium sp. MDB2-A-1]TFC09707.1 hypothetical protein E3O35_14185 [Cryobacterium sp. MDB2-A-2]TFC22667.1 hypothetical protein E3O46_04315 [Cryobacterium glucosi]TFC23961.1 hypothetical protein E3O51_00100 [Cryobacterium sp. MDB2-10]